MILKRYQQKAINELIEDASDLLNSSNSKTLVFKAPTGSGKTIVMAEFIKQLSEDKNLKNEFSVIWTAPRKLHEQSKKKLEDYYQTSRAITCSFFDDLNDRRIDTNEILFFNWESINKKNAIYIRENEQENNLSKIIERTKEEGRKIILVIDESHFASGSDDEKQLSAAKKLRNDIEPDLTIEVSATPKITGDKTVSAIIDDVKQEEMIKKSIVVNPEFKNVFDHNRLITEIPGPDKNSDELLLITGLEKREELEKAYEKEVVNVKPLLLIQIPDKNRINDLDVKDKIIGYLKNRNITEENDKLKIYLSEEKSEGLDLISKNDDETEVLIFKQGIALGWDCPRAQILVLFREWRSLTFSIQTIGRIMRMPEPEKGYYKEEILNHAYVYTNFSNIEVQEDIAGGYVTIKTSKRKNIYKDIDLYSVYTKRQREKTRFTPTFIQIFLNEAKKYKLKDKVKEIKQRVSASLIRNYEHTDVDSLVHKEIEGSVSIKIENEEDLQKLFDQFAADSLAPEFYPEPRSVERIKTAIYYFFSTALGIKYTKRFKEVINIVLSDDNVNKFKHVINNAKQEYQKGVIDKESELVDLEKWNIPEMIVTSSNLDEVKTKKCIMEPFLFDNKWRSEKAFIDFLENNENVEWWFKNGEGDATYFAVPYTDNGTKAFYVDFIVKFKNGKLGFFDPHGEQFKDLVPKAEGLNLFLKSNTKYIGGIIRNTDVSTYKGAWQTYNIKSKKWDNLKL